ncbi:TNF receptor-associated factor 2-like [Amphiura filiformis]|uniref:TNF receptor-associated factor 2-like n=1 Tax=Amphiura filiformis TaxID=82378 RepID=UPI003B226053
MPGYPPEVLVDQTALSTTLLCCICSKLLKSAVQSTCGHRYCETCVKEKVAGSRIQLRCPACLVEDSEDGILQSYNPDFYVRKQLQNLQAKCLLEGCEWSGIYQELDSHKKSHDGKSEMQRPLTERETDPRGDVAAAVASGGRTSKRRYCEEETLVVQTNKRPLTERETDPRGDVAAAVASGGRTSKRRYCEEETLVVQTNKKVFVEQETDSRGAAPTGGTTKRRHRGEDDSSLQPKQMFVESCETDARDGGVSSVNYNKEEDTSATQPEISGDRDFSEHQQSPVGKMESLMKQLKVSHIQGVPSNYLEAGEEKIKELEKKIAKYGDELNKLSSRYGMLDKRDQTDQKVVKGLNYKVEAITERASALEEDNMQLQASVNQNQQKLHAQDQIEMAMNATFAEQDMKIQTLESTSYSGILVWKITEVARRRQEAVSGKTTSFYSSPFYTSYHGYKMCARVYLNGDGTTKGTHLSLFFVVMKGRYDNILHWPFRQKVTFMMVDQGNREHVVDTFRPDPTSSSFKKPTSEMNIASGCPLFVALTLLENGNFAYVKDDCLFVKVIVDVSDLEKS